MRVIGTEHPHLRATQIDVDAAADAEQLAQQLLSGSEEDETAWRDGQWYVARLSPTPLLPEERRTVDADTAEPGCACRSARPGDLQSTGTRRVRPRPAGAGADRGRGQRIQHQLRRRAGRVRPLPRVRRATAAAGHRLRRRGHRRRAGCHRAQGRRPRRRAVGRRLLGHVHHLRCQPGRHVAGRAWRRAGRRADHRDRHRVVRLATTWPASRPATRC